MFIRPGNSFCWPLMQRETFQGLPGFHDFLTSSSLIFKLQYGAGKPILQPIVTGRSENPVNLLRAVWQLFGLSIEKTAPRLV